MTKDLFARVQPRDEVLAGALTEAVFAASLDEVVVGAAPATYQDPRTFFAGTHPSSGLRTLLNEALGRLSGHRPDAPSVIRLETSLGGGKTHNLIALYHAARGALDGPTVVEFMDPANLPEGSVEQVGVFVGTGAGATTRSRPAASASCWPPTLPAKG
jgi:predicted AAA+ superfamily ATPase